MSERTVIVIRLVSRRRAQRRFRVSRKHVFVCVLFILSVVCADICEILLIWFWWLQYNRDMKTGAVDIDHVLSENNSCLSCGVSGSVTFLLVVATYFYFRCKHTKPVYYLGTPSMHNTTYLSHYFAYLWQDYYWKLLMFPYHSATLLLFTISIFITQFIILYFSFTGMISLAVAKALDLKPFNG